MQLIDLTSITISPKRQRRNIEPSALVDLENSILKNGLIHPPTFRKTGDDLYSLVAGERRTRAIQKIAAAGKTFYCNGQLVPVGKLPTLSLQENLSQAALKEIEFDENKIREALPWQDEAEALAEIHRLRQDELGTAATFKSTAEVLVETGQVPKDTSIAYQAQRVRQAVTLADNLNNPTIAKARNATEAYNLVLKVQEEQFTAALATRRLAVIPAEETLTTVRHGSCVEILPKLDEHMADLILSDPPFGINADKGGFRQRTVQHHNYEDTPENARNLYQAILLEGFRVAKPTANILLFCDIDMFMMLREMAGRVGWTPFRTPIIWQKSHSEGMAPWQGKGFRRTYEMIFYATKGQRGLITSPVDILDHRRVPKQERLHAAQKPLDLLTRLIECSTLPGDFVLDPCCGSGAVVRAAKDAKRRGLGIEVDQTFFNTAMSFVHGDNSVPSEGSTVRSGVSV